MENLSAQAVGQAFVVIAFAIVGAYRLWAGHAKSEGKPPESRPLPQNELKNTCENMQRSIDALHTKLERHTEITIDDLRDISRQLDRLEAAMRLSSAVSDIERRFGQHPRRDHE